MTPATVISRVIQRERTHIGMSLSALAAQAGIAKSTLSQLEAGQGNPSLETLWAIATALNIPLSVLFEVRQPVFTIIRAGEGEPLSSEVADYSVTLLSACPPGKRRDIYRTQMLPGSVRHSKPHPHGTVEHVFVCHGQVQLGPVGNTETVETGDYFSYPADVEHVYECFGGKATLLVVMEGPA